MQYAQRQALLQILVWVIGGQVAGYIARAVLTPSGDRVGVGAVRCWCVLYRVEATGSGT